MKIIEVDASTFKVLIGMLVAHSTALWYCVSRCVLRIYFKLKPEAEFEGGNDRAARVLDHLDARAYRAVELGIEELQAPDEVACEADEFPEHERSFASCYEHLVPDRGWFERGKRNA